MIAPKLSPSLGRGAPCFFQFGFAVGLVLSENIVCLCFLVVGVCSTWSSRERDGLQHAGTTLSPRHLTHSTDSCTGSPCCIFEPLHPELGISRGGVGFAPGTRCSESAEMEASGKMSILWLGENGADEDRLKYKSERD